MAPLGVGLLTAFSTGNPQGEQLSSRDGAASPAKILLALSRCKKRVFSKVK